MPEMIHRTNEDGTCLYCGKRLRPFYPEDQLEVVRGEDTTSSEGYTVRHERRVPKAGARPLHFGYDSAGYFCTARCGYRFGVALAKADMRLKPYEGER